MTRNQRLNMVRRTPEYKVLTLPLRDYFAAAALQGWCANPMAENITSETLALMAYIAADEMLKRREEPGLYHENEV